MWFLNFRRVAKAGLLNFWRMPVVASASVIAITVALFVIGVIWLGQAFFSGAISTLQDKVDVSVFIVPTANESDILKLKTSLAALPEVKQVTYSSKEQELQEFRNQNQDNELIAQSLAEVGNPFGARLDIKAVDPAHYGSINTFLGGDDALASTGQSIIDRVSFKKNVVDQLIQLTDSATKVGWVVALVFVALSIIVTFNTVAVVIYISRDEIGLMKLVGASNFYIRGPFIVTGMIAGVIAALIALLLLYPSVIWLRNITIGVYGGVDLVNYFLDHFGSLFLLLLAAGVGLGVASSFLSVRRHLKV